MSNSKGGGGRVRNSELFDRALIETINIVLNDIIGENAVSALFQHLERHCSLKTEEIPKNPSRFMDELENILGKGAILIEGRIIKNLYSKFGLEYQKCHSWRFGDYVKHARKHLRLS